MRQRSWPSSLSPKESAARFLFSTAAIDIPIPDTDSRTGEFVFQKTHRFWITAHTLDGMGPSATNRYVQSVKLNGIPLNHPYVTYDQLKAGGDLDFSIWSAANDASIYRLDGKESHIQLAPTVR